MSAGATVAVGSGSSAAALTVADGADTAVGPTGGRVSDAGEVCSPPQAARAVRTARHMRTSVGTRMVPGNLRCLRAMAQFPAPGTV